MIFGHIGLALNLLTIGVISFVAALFTVSALSHFTRSPSLPFNAVAKRRLLWGLVTLPWVASVVSMALLTVPDLLQQYAGWLSSIAHFHHVYEFNILSWHGLTLLLFCGFFVCLFLRRIINAAKTSLDLCQLDYFSEVHKRKPAISVLRADIPLAFTSGFFRPRFYLTTGLLAKLTEQEFDIVERHELAHARSFDPILKYLFSFFAAFFPRAIEVRLNHTMALVMEQNADETVLKQVPDEALIAKTILKVVRLCNAYNVSHTPSLVSCNFVGDQLQQRIHYLMNEDKGRPFPVWSFTLLTLCLIVTSALSVDLAHHTVERIFTH
jgi:beta-lactamase regulating signal transducer with metallopeptidase domain